MSVYYDDDDYEGEIGDYGEYPDDEEIDEYKSEDDEPSWEMEQQEMKPGVKAYEHVVFAGEGLVDVPQNELEKKNMDPLSRFRFYADAIARDMNNYKGVNISNDTIVVMLEKAELLEHVEGKNPTAYILGFLATNGTKLTKQGFNFVNTKLIPQLKLTSSVSSVDVVRYGRLWEKL